MPMWCTLFGVLQLSLVAQAGPVDDAVADLREQTPWEVAVVLVGDASEATARGGWAGPIEARVPDSAAFAELAEVLAAEDPPRCAVAAEVRPDGSWAARLAAVCERVVVAEAAVPEPAEQTGLAEAEAPQLSMAYRRRALSWTGEGRVQRGTLGITTRRFARLTDDAETLQGLARVRQAYLPGGVVFGAGLVVGGVAAGAVVLGAVVFAVEAVECVVGLFSFCDFSTSRWLFETAGVLLPIAGVGLAVGAVGLALGALHVVPRVKLLKWYTPEDVRARIDAHNQALRAEQGLTSTAHPRGELSLELSGAGLRLRAVF